MVGSKPNAYLSEEARLEAQRRMLAERYGLLSDESDDNDSGEEEAESTPAQNGMANPNGETHSEQNGQPPDDSGTGGTNALEDPAPSEAATYGEGSSVHDGDISAILSQEEGASGDGAANTEEKPAHQRTPEARPPGWPGVELVDDERRIFAQFDYCSVRQSDAVSSRDLRVTPITVYSSQLLPKHGRKIAVNDQIITYAVGGHIRAILRNSAVRALLKGHESAISDVEFLGHEKRLDTNSGNSISILGSVAEDGSVYVWKVVRNDSQKEDTLEVADAIRFEHPEIAEGRSYSRVSFRPGPSSIIAENGIGVAMLLVDSESPDVRLVELVKMNGKMMVRDKFLKAHKEIDFKLSGDTAAPIDSAAWLSERMVATSRQGRVHLWNTDSALSTCVASLPREKSTKVTSLYAFNQEALLLVIDAGRELEVWVAEGFAPDVDCTSLELRQTIRLMSTDQTDVFTVTSVDPFEELVMLSNVKGNSFFVLHYNPAAQAFDAITEVPVKQSIFSFCTTRNLRKSTAAALGAQVLNAEPVEELGIWCVQPKGISLIHLPVRDCAPKEPVKPEVYPKPTQKTVMRKVERVPPSSSVPSAVTPSVPAAPENVRNPSTLSASQSSSRSQPSPSVDTALPGHPRAPNISTGQLTNQNRSSSSTSVTSASNAPAEEVKKTVVGASSASPVPSTHVQGLSIPPAAEPAPTPDEVADSIIEAARKAISAYDMAAGQRSAAEKVKMDRLIEHVAETAKSNLERFVNQAMKKVVQETMLPGMTKIITDTRTAIQNARSDPKVTTAYFEAAMEKSKIANSFSNACQEMERQVSASVTQSLTAKYDTLIDPAVNSVTNATEDLTTSLSLLRQQMAKMTSKEDNRGNVVESEPVDIRASIEEDIERGDLDGAFQRALDMEDLSLVLWLCEKFDASTFFEAYTLSQVSLLALAAQLGQCLDEGDVRLKVDWLHELMLVLEPESEDLAGAAHEPIKQLVDNVAQLRANKELLGQYEGLEKRVRTLNRLIASHLPDNYS